MFMMADDLIFSEWILLQMTQRKLTKTDLAKRSGLSRAVIHKTIKQLNNQPAVETCQGIARAFGVSQVVVFRRAGLITEPVDVPEPSPEVAEITAILLQLSPVAQAEMLDYLRVKQRYDKK